MGKYVFDLEGKTADEAVEIVKFLATHGVNVERVGAEPVPSKPAPVAPSVAKAKVRVMPVPQKATGKKAERRARKVSAPTPEKAETLLKAVGETDGSISAIVKASGLDKGPAQRGLKALREAGQIAMHGDKRWARYGLTKADAEARSKAAKSGDAVTPKKAPRRIVTREPASGAE